MIILIHSDTYLLQNLIKYIGDISREAIILNQILDIKLFLIRLNVYISHFVQI